MDANPIIISNIRGGNFLIYRVVVVDDNRAYVDMLTKNFPWNDLRLQLCSVQYRGDNALTDIAYHKPHIVITDINMPDTDGLELVRRAQAIVPDAHFILITAYDSFQYAYQAVKLHAFDMLLKPFTRDELKSVILRAVAELEKQDEDEENTYSPLVQSMVDAIQLDLSQNITLEMLSKKLGSSVSSLSRELKRNTGLRFSELLTQLRLEEAERLLVRSTMRISDIAEKVGYKNYITLYKVFMRIRGVSPTSYRKGSYHEDP